MSAGLSRGRWAWHSHTDTYYCIVCHSRNICTEVSTIFLGMYTVGSSIDLHKHTVTMALCYISEWIFLMSMIDFQKFLERHWVKYIRTILRKYCKQKAEQVDKFDNKGQNYVALGRGRSEIKVKKNNCWSQHFVLVYESSWVLERALFVRIKLLS